MGLTATSSGDEFADPSDGWIVLSPNDGVSQPDVNENAMVTSGPGARAVRPQSGSARGPTNYGATWEELTVEPGQTALLMSFMIEAPAEKRRDRGAGPTTERADRPGCLGGPHRGGESGDRELRPARRGPVTGLGDGPCRHVLQCDGPDGTPSLSRMDPTVDFDWADGSPDAVVPTDEFPRAGPARCRLR
jgi:hypothetical protein